MHSLHYLWTASKPCIYTSMVSIFKRSNSTGNYVHLPHHLKKHCILFTQYFLPYGDLNKHQCFPKRNQVTGPHNEDGVWSLWTQTDFTSKIWNISFFNYQVYCIKLITHVVRWRLKRQRTLTEIKLKQITKQKFIEFTVLLSEREFN